MKLELKHLAPYLPYKLNAKNCFNDIIEIKGLQLGSESVNNELWIFKKDGNYLKGYLYQCKPILRTLSDLNSDELLLIVDHIFRDSKGIRPKPGSIKVDKGYITFYDNNTMQNYVAVKPSQDGTPLLNMSNCFDDYSIFFKLHVDMFNLIPVGLAIDINKVSELLNT